MHKHAKFIDAMSKHYGGQRPLAEEITKIAGKRVTFKMVSNWKKSGVPWRFRGAVSMVSYYANANADEPRGFTYKD